MQVIKRIFFVTSVMISSVIGVDPLDRFMEWARDFRIHFYDETHSLSMYQKWLSNDQFIRDTNERNLTYSLGHNAFSGMDIDDFRRLYLWDSRLRKERELNYDIKPVEYNTIPSSIDWTLNGAVTPVKDQGQCGSCWSFSATGALEGAVFLQTGNLISFSEQQLVDCDTLKNGGRDHGCNGGLMDNAFTWIGKNNGLCTEQDYPYISGTTKTGNTCQTKCITVKGSDVESYIDVSPSSDDAMLAVLSKRPVSVAIEADQREFQLYKSGVFTGVCGTKLDHGVLVTGYGSEMDKNGNKIDYYLVKNSWSTSWGLGGYIKLGRGINPETEAPYNNGDGQCGLLLEASYPMLFHQ
jgi:hypothetical protein